MKYSVVALGAGGVGKTCLISQFIGEEFNNEYEPTIEDCYGHIVHLPNDRHYSVRLLDTGGTHNFPAMTDLSIRLGQAFIMVFSITDRQSYTEAIRIGEKIVTTHGHDVPMVLVGNKMDCSDQRLVESDEATLMAAERFQCPYVETSAKLNMNIRALFSDLIMKALNLEEKVTQKEKRSFLLLSLGAVKIFNKLKLNNNFGSSRRSKSKDLLMD